MSSLLLPALGVEIATTAPVTQRERTNQFVDQAVALVAEKGIAAANDTLRSGTGAG